MSILCYWKKKVLKHNAAMWEITIGDCHKCDLETIIDPNNSQHFWINRRDVEIESKRNWQAIFDKYKEDRVKNIGNN